MQAGQLRNEARHGWRRLGAYAAPALFLVSLGCGEPYGLEDDAAGDEVQLESQSEALEDTCNRKVAIKLEPDKIFAYHVPGFEDVDDEFGGSPVDLRFNVKLRLDTEGAIWAEYDLSMKEINGPTYLANDGVPRSTRRMAWFPPPGCKVKRFIPLDGAPVDSLPPNEGSVRVSNTGKHNHHAATWYEAVGGAKTSAIRGATCVTDTDGGIFGGSDAGKVWCEPQFYGFWAELMSTTPPKPEPPLPPPPPVPLHEPPADVIVGNGPAIGGLMVLWTPQGRTVESYDLEHSGDCTGPACTWTTLVSGLAPSSTRHIASMTPGAWYNVRVCSSSLGERLCSAESYGQARKQSIRPPGCPKGWFRCDDLTCKPKASQCEFLP